MYLSSIYKILLFDFCNTILEYELTQIITKFIIYKFYM